MQLQRMVKCTQEKAAEEVPKEVGRALRGVLLEGHAVKFKVT